MIHQENEPVSGRTVSSLKVVAVFAIVCFVAYGTASAADEDGQIRQLEPVKLMHPVDGWDATDFAVSFRWERQCDFEEKWTTKLYRLQVAGDSSFQEPVIDVEQKAPGRDNLDNRDNYYTEAAYMPRTFLKPGAYYWRVRVADGNGGPWSKVWRFTVNDYHPKVPLINEISPASPLIIFDMFGALEREFRRGATQQTLMRQWEKYWSFVPDDIKPYVALDLGREGGRRMETQDHAPARFFDWLAPALEAGIPITINTGTCDQDFQMASDPTELEMLFQQYPNLVGVTTGENFWAYGSADRDPEGSGRAIHWVNRLVALCAKYGRVFVFGEGNWREFKWDRFFGEEHLGGEMKVEWMNQDFLREHADYFIPCSKTNIVWGNFQSESAILGAWLDGMMTNTGMWGEAWYWHDVGYKEMFSPQLKYSQGNLRYMPPCMWNQFHISGIARGATVFKFGGESSTTEWGTYDAATDSFDDGSKPYTAMWDMHGHKTAVFDRYIVPFIRAVVKHKMIPAKQEVMKEVKIAVAPAPVDTDKGDAMAFGHYAPLYRATYGIDEFVATDEIRGSGGENYNQYIPTGCRYEVLHNTGRYYYIPILPYPARDIGGSAIEEVKIENLQDMTAVKSLYESKYPPRYGGDAWVVLVSDKVFIMNNHENRNIMQTFDIPLDGSGNISRIVGRAIPHAYIMGKRLDSDNGFWFQANANHKGPYTDGRTTQMRFTCKRKPKVTVTPADAAVENKWDGGRHELSLILSHQDGAVEVDLTL